MVGIIVVTYFPWARMNETMHCVSHFLVSPTKTVDFFLKTKLYYLNNYFGFDRKFGKGVASHTL